MKNRSELRDIIVKVLYQINILKSANIEYNIEELIKEFIEVENEFVNSSINGILDSYEEIIDLANKNLENWELNRLNKVDQAIIMLGIYELLKTDTPDIVAINEAIELSKKYSDEKITKMINAVLDNIYKNKTEDK